MNDYSSHYNPQYLKLNEILQQLSTSLMGSVVNHLQNINIKLDDEFLLNVQERQINEALARFVTRNVKMVLSMTAELHQGWFRIYCTINFKGMYIRIASNFTLVHVQMDRQRQRFVFAQQGDTEVLELHCNSFIKKKAIEYGVPLFRTFKKADPLGIILQETGLARIKDNIIYLDIGRWIKGDKKIMSYLHKVQINYATVSVEQLILQAKVNVRDLIATDETGDIITDKDKPKSTADTQE